MAVALVVAAGRGERLGTDAPKAFVELCGRPMICWSLDALAELREIDAVIVALPPGVSAPAGTTGVAGGASRSASVRAALAAAPGGADPVLVHDAARPLLTAELALAVLDGLGECDCAIAATPVSDTIKELGADGLVRRTLDRDTLWAVQTPQVFRRAALERALEVPDDVLARATDEASLVERAGGRVRVVRAPAENLKVTTAFDLLIAERLLAKRA